jgi:hypothetical protein
MNLMKLRFEFHTDIRVMVECETSPTVFSAAIVITNFIQIQQQLCEMEHQAVRTQLTLCSECRYDNGIPLVTFGGSIFLKVLCTQKRPGSCLTQFIEGMDNSIFVQ